MTTNKLCNFLYKTETKLFISNTLFLTLASSLRHFWFNSSSWDLGIFEQAIFLISKGQEPFSSLLGFHILGDHGALILYPLALFYKIFPSTYFLFFLQSSALSLSIYPLNRLSKSNNISKKNLYASYAAFLLYPIIFNVNIFDFHPEVIAFPIVLDIFVSLKTKEIKASWEIFLKTFFILTCKITNSFLVIGFGIWLIIKGFRKLGYLLIFLSTLWFNLIAFFLIPYFGKENALIFRQAEKFGLSENFVFNISTLVETISQLFIQIFSISNLEYLFLLILPFIYILLNKKRLKFFFNFIPFSPLILLNLISDSYPMKNLVHQYSLFIVPFIAVSIQESLSPKLEEGLKNYPKWFQKRTSKFIFFWSIFTFLIFSRFTFFLGPFHNHFESALSRREAIERINNNSSILTTNDLVPHLSKRKNIKFTNSEINYNLDEFDEILLDLKEPGWKSNKDFVDKIHKNLRASNRWFKKYEKDNIILFEKIR